LGHFHFLLFFFIYQKIDPARFSSPVLSPIANSSNEYKSHMCGISFPCPQYGPDFPHQYKFTMSFPIFRRRLSPPRTHFAHFPPGRVPNILPVYKRRLFLCHHPLYALNRTCFAFWLDPLSVSPPSSGGVFFLAPAPPKGTKPQPFTQAHKTSPRGCAKRHLNSNNPRIRLDQSDPFPRQPFHESRLAVFTFLSSKLSPPLS